MLTKTDKTYIADLLDKKMDEKFSDFAMIIQNSFNQVFQVLDTKADKEDVAKVEKNLTYRIDVLEHKIVGAQGRRIDRIEDDIRLVKTKLNLS